MIITNNIRLSRILNLTWKTDLLLLFSCFLAYCADKYIIIQYFLLPSIIPTILGTALAFFIGFNNNQAYDRWWEARKIWGALVNDSRSWARGILSYLSKIQGKEEELISLQTKMIKRHLGFIYALKSYLRDNDNEGYKKFLNEEDFLYLENQSNIHNAILTLQSKDLEYLSLEGFIDGFKFLQFNELIINFCDEMGKAERIKNTVFPTTYHYFTKLFIWLFSVVVTIVSTETTGIWSVLIGTVIGFVFHTSHIIGNILLNPFALYPTGVALDQISRTIEINLLEMLKEKDIPGPIKPKHNEYIM